MTMTAYETCRSCGCAPCECPRGKDEPEPAPRYTTTSWRSPTGRRGPRLRPWEWVEYVAVCALIWVAVVQPAFPGVPGGSCGVA
jgi:hypothetical protein